VNVKTPGTGEIVGAWALHAGDRIAVPVPGGTVAAVVKAIRDIPDPVAGGGDHELTWESLDHRHSDCLHYSPADLVNRLSANGAVL